MSREFDTSKEDVWVRTAKGSMHGSYVLALSMAMWRQLYREDDSMEDFNKAFDDVVWVLDHSLAALRSGTAGAGVEEEGWGDPDNEGKEVSNPAPYPQSPWHQRLFSCLFIALVPPSGPKRRSRRIQCRPVVA